VVLVKLINQKFSVVNFYQLITASVFSIFLISCQDNKPAVSGDENGVDTPVVRNAAPPSPVIFDSDMGPDYDDVGAITMLHNFADDGSANILATIASTKYQGVAEVFDAFNTYFNRPDIPVGIPTGKASELRDNQHWSDTVRMRYPHSIKSNKDAEDAVKLYRRILASQHDTSVTIITVGFITNIANLLKSEGDSSSPMNGIELVNKKVKKLVSMAGRFPQGSEFNVNIDAASSRYAFENFPRPVIFSGFEIGKDIKTGIPLISDNSIQNSPVKDVFRISIPMSAEDSAGRMSWDETAVLVAIKGHEPYYTLNSGRIVVDEKGANKWNNEGTGHSHLVVKAPPAEVQELINKLIMHQPVKK
jgi:pyrimidine-specific ribonucleoside hydrolase